jgi:hypothetical protein
MIGKQVKGRGFRGCLNYLLIQKKGQIIGGNMAGQTLDELSHEFGLSRRLNPHVSRAVYHASLSVSEAETLSDEQWKEIAENYLQKMNFTQNQYLVVKHTDTQHNHIHLVASRIRLDGKCVSDSWDYRRSADALREIEQHFGLQSPQQKHPERRSYTTGEWRLRKRTGESSIRDKLQSVLDASCPEANTLPELLQSLWKQGIETEVKYTRSGLVKGISYKLDGMAFTGTHLGKAYTFPGLQKYQKIDYQSLRDDPFLQQYSFDKQPQLQQAKLTDSLTAKSIFNNREKAHNWELE